MNPQGLPHTLSWVFGLQAHRKAVRFSPGFCPFEERTKRPFQAYALPGSAISIALYLKFHHHTETTHPQKPKLHFLNIADFTVTVAPIGIFLGRIGNFINSELYGRISPDNKFCLNFPTDPTNCRYPSQLFESLGEGLMLFIIIYFLSKQPKITKHPGRLTAIFLILYGLIRTIIENFREADAQVGYLLSGVIPGLVGLSLGQIFSILTTLTGVIILVCVTKRTSQLKQF